MGFFEPPPPPESPQPYRHEPMFGPADNLLGAGVPLTLLLAQNEHVAVAITGATAYPYGVELNVSVRIRNLPPEARQAMRHGGPFHVLLDEEAWREGIPPELLRLGVQFSDGRKAATVGGDHLPSETDPEAMPPILSSHGGGGNERAWNAQFWLWPLPPPGPLVFVTEWPIAGIDLTRVEVDADLILEASLEAQELWAADESTAVAGGTVMTNFTVGSRLRQEKAVIALLEKRGYTVSPPPAQPTT